MKNYNINILDPAECFQKGGLLPLGGVEESGGYKGKALKSWKLNFNSNAGAWSLWHLDVTRP